MDERPTRHLDPGTRDLCTCFDYRSLDVSEALLREWSSYEDIILIGWSLGVWAAGIISPEVPATKREPITNTGTFLRRIAINGTPTPVDDDKGIPEAIFRGTLEHLNEVTLQKFIRRLAGSPEEYAFFRQQAPQRTFSDQQEELVRILQQVQHLQETPSSMWDTALIGTRDHIFPPANMHQAWAGATRTVSLNLPHYPFGSFHSWQQIIGL